MKRRLVRGRLEDAAAAPAEGERTTTLAELGAASIEQTLSGSLPAPLAFTQDHDEWVLLVHGRARLAAGGEELELEAGDWLLLPGGCPHSVVETEPGTSWLAVHVGRRS